MSRSMVCKYCGAPVGEGGDVCRVCLVRLASEADFRVWVWLALLFLGGLGVHRFMLGGRHIGWGVVYLLTGALCWVGLIYDLCHLSGWLREHELESLRR